MLRWATPVQGSLKIIEFGARETLALAVLSPSDKHLAIGQERRGMEDSFGRHAARRGPQPGRRIIEFGARENLAEVGVLSSSDKHLAIGRKRRDMVVSLVSHTARLGP